MPNIELHFLVFTIILGLVHLVFAATAFTLQHGLAYAMGARDEQKPTTGNAARLVRSFSNFMETFALFAAAVLIGQVMGVHNEKTALGVELYFAARVLYIPLYVFGIKGARTLVWGVSIVGIVLLLCGMCHSA